jgi:ligand-binding sensor domain-containing protein
VFGADSNIWIATREGAYYSADDGATWTHAMEGLPAKNVLRIEAEDGRLLATAYGARSVFESRDNGRSWHMSPDAGLNIRTAALMKGRLVAATNHNGIMIERERENASQPGMGQSTKSGGGGN